MLCRLRKIYTVWVMALSVRNWRAASNVDIIKLNSRARQPLVALVQWAPLHPGLDPDVLAARVRLMIKSTALWWSMYETSCQNVSSYRRNYEIA